MSLAGYNANMGGGPMGVYIGISIAVGLFLAFAPCGGYLIWRRRRGMREQEQNMQLTLAQVMQSKPRCQDVWVDTSTRESSWADFKPLALEIIALASERSTLSRPERRLDWRGGVKKIIESGGPKIPESTESCFQVAVLVVDPSGKQLQLGTERTLAK
ncbi:hypothetical protein CYLTODRAFT_492320 [Cylindrobasidium torrendii FP15055 ss-10]|uniref:Uncharacterized protein n=1 Tax=Cylindrobasidium torrendii FP15055 ss-10 TaxID=1314674 RepID=A0A0D7B4L8_9AGAR|nr:hypothetical protein CYLTODRAFT_492320 [Cylindrobasidium torrendii FP15055 ss-10]